ncbi:MAG: hypothetical protein AAGH43_12335 [Pseudomonadota bacterium]
MTWRLTILLAFALLAVPSQGSFVGGSQALAQSPATPSAWCTFDGESVWRDRGADQNELGRITIELRCLDGVVTGVRVLAETRCGRTLCTWNWSEEARAEESAIAAIFATFSATRLMRIQLAGDRINVEVENDYNQAGRASDQMRASLVLDN